MGRRRREHKSRVSRRKRGRGGEPGIGSGREAGEGCYESQRRDFRQRIMHAKKEEGAQEQGEQEKTRAGHGAVRVAVCQGVGEENQALDRGERLEKAATSPKDETFANESCMGRRRREHKSRVSRRKRGRGTAR